MAEQLSLTRRRVLIGAAWATPAVLIATAAPAAAASTTRGAIALSSLVSTMTGTTLYVRGQVAYSGAGSPSPDAPVSSVQLKITMPYTRITVATPPTVTPNTGWSYAGPYTTSGSGSARTVTYTFTYTSPQPLSSANPITAQLAVSFAKSSSVNTLNVTYMGSGVSLLAPMTATSAIGTTNVGTIRLAATGNSVAWNARRGGYVPGNIPIYRLRGTVRNAGVAANGSRPGAAKISDIKVTFTIAASALASPLAIYPYSPGSIDAAWGSPAVTLAGGVYTIVYTYSPSTAGPTGNTTTAVLDVAIRAASTTKVVNAATITATGVSEGFALTTSQVGPA
jgi:hypothetical protein